MSGVDAPAPWRTAFDNARDPYTARNALGILPTGEIIADSVIGTTTNDDAAAGYVGEFIECTGTAATASVTISNASPAVITDAAHGLSIGQAVVFNTGGSLPTGITAGANYYVSSQGYAAGAYSVSTSVVNALAGTSVNTSSAGSGAHTRFNGGSLTTVTNLDLGGFSLTAGDWDVDCLLRFGPGATTTVNTMQGWTNSVSSTQPTQMYIGILGYNAAVLVNSSSVTPLTRRYSLASTTTIFGTARANFGTSTLVVTINMRARRVR